MINKIYFCRVCGLYQEDPPWGISGKDPSRNICPCCGIEFGYEDFSLEAIREKRKQWINRGAKWFCPKEKPENWSLEEQMKNIPDEFLRKKPFNFNIGRAMKFSLEECHDGQDFDLVYRDEEYSFDIDPYENEGFTSILVNDLQLEINDQGEVLYVWGYCPLINYEETTAFPKKIQKKSLFAILVPPPIPGVSYKLNENERWNIYINKKKGWICLGNPKTKNVQMVEFSPHCVATLENQEIIAIWLHPFALPEHIK